MQLCSLAVVQSCSHAVVQSTAVALTAHLSPLTAHLITSTLPLLLAHLVPTSLLVPLHPQLLPLLQHQLKRLTEIIMNGSFKDGILDGCLNETNLPAGANIECFHDQLAIHGRLKIADCILFFNFFQLVPHHLKVGQEFLYFRIVLGCYVRLTQASSNPQYHHRLQITACVPQNR